MHSPKAQHPKDPKPLEELFGKNSLQYIFAKAQWLLQIEEVIKSQLPNEFASVKVVNVNDHTLTLEVCNAGLATRLRFEEPHLLYALTQCMPNCTAIGNLRCRVRPAKIQAAPDIKIPPNKSSSSAELVDSAAEGVESPELKAALKRLARTLEEA